MYLYAPLEYLNILGSQVLAHCLWNFKMFLDLRSSEMIWVLSSKVIAIILMQVPSILLIVYI